MLGSCLGLLVRHVTMATDHACADTLMPDTYLSQERRSDLRGVAIAALITDLTSSSSYILNSVLYADLCCQLSKNQQKISHHRKDCFFELLCRDQPCLQSVQV